MRDDAAQALAALADTEAVLLRGISLPGATAPAPTPTPSPAAHRSVLAGPERPGATEAETDAETDAEAGETEPGVAPVDDEPVYDRAAARDIQGNVIPGFNKSHQQFLFLRFGPVAGTRRWLVWLAPRLSTMDEVLAFRRAFRAERLRLGVREPDLTATWTSVALSHRGITALVGAAEADGFGDESFRQGLAARSTYLGDPSDPTRRGHRGNWVVGGPDNEADALVIIAADGGDDLQRATDDVVAAATEHGLSVVFAQRGENLPGNLEGHEHFGFKDGISQPGVRGRVAGEPDGRLTPRHLADDDPHARLFAKPGQPLVWPGQFLLGEPRQDPQDPMVPAPPTTAFPAWAARGSYLVVRRLDQDVVGFWDLAASAASAVGLTPVELASAMVGRWPSGAPLPRAPEADDPALAGDEFANNHFLFDDDTRPSALGPIDGYAGDDHRAAAADLFGRICPHAAHIRKVNPRDSGTDFGAAADTFLRLMLRRGIPYGDPIAGVADPGPELVAAERGLLFAAYMSSIEDQFEFVSRRWANSTVQPNLGGHDPIIGQRDDDGGRQRTFSLPRPDGSSATIDLPDDLVTPTGGGYFFAPPISAVAGPLAGLDP